MASGMTERRGRPLRSGMLFRFGFVCAPSGETACLPDEVKRGWTFRRFGDLDLHLHPETGVQRAGITGHRFLLAGDLPGAPLAERLRPLGGGATGAPAGDAAVLDLIDGMSGRFALFWSSGGTTRLLADAAGSRAIFYARAPFPAAASHAELVPRPDGAAPDAAVAKLIEAPEYRALRVRYLPGDATILDGVFALPPNHALDLGSGRVSRFWPRRATPRATAAGFGETCSQYLRRLRRDLEAQGRTALFGLTGGIDSRALFSAWTEAGTAFETVTWLAPNFSPGERPITERLAHELGRPHAYLDLAAHAPGRAAAIAQRNAGRHRGKARLAEAMHGAYGHREGLVFVRGLGAAILRGFYNDPRRADAPLRDLSPREMARAYHSGLKRGAAPGPGWLALGERLFEEHAARIGLAAAPAFGHDPSDLFYWEHRLARMGADMLIEMDPAMPTLVGFNDRRLFEAALGLPARDRFSKTLLLEVTGRHDPALAAVPVHNLRRRAHGARLGRWGRMTVRRLRGGAV